MPIKQTIVFAPATFNLAETTRMIEVARHLHTTCDCQFFGFSTTHAAWITKNGFPFTLLTPVLTKEQEKQIIALDQLKGMKNPFTVDLVAARVKSELAYLAEKQPTAVITGTNMTIFLSARIAKIPLVYVKPYALSRPQLENDSQTVFDSLMTKVTWRPKAFREVAKQYRLVLPKYSIELLDGDENLITTFRDFTSWQDYPANYHNVGPMFAQLTDSLPSDLRVTLKSARRNQQPIVYFALGSSGNPQLAHNILKVLAETNLLVLAPLKQYLLEEDIRAYHDSSIMITDLLPTPLLAPYLSFSIIHGGEGTVQTACISGKPFIGYGLQQEQTMNLKYCEAYGNAIRLKANPFSAKQLQQAISRIQTEAYLKKATKLAEVFHGDGASHAAKFIKEKYLRKASQNHSALEQ